MKGPKFLKGYTLIELTVALVILSLLGIFLLSSSLEINKTRSTLLLDTDSLVGYIRDMQNRTTSFISSNIENNIGYGIFIDTKNNTKVESFYKIDKNTFKVSEITSSQKPASDLIFTTGNHIKKICINDCKETVSSVAIYFVKPKPYAKFVVPDGSTYSDTTSTGESISKICIEINTMPKGKVGIESRIVEIFNIGQMSFSGGNCE